MDCPACGPGSQKYHLGLNKARGYLNCWVCGPKPLVSTLAEISGWRPGDIVRLLREVLPVREALTARKTGRYKPPVGVDGLGPAHRQYLADRGFNPDEIAALWGVGGIGVAPRMSWRLFIPIIYRHETVSWTTRAIGDVAARYISASPKEESLNHKHLLYGLDMACHAVAIVEGPTDAWAIGPGAVGQLGLVWTPQQVKLMIKFPVRVVCFDNTLDAQARARKLTNTLSLYPGDTYRVCLSGKDPAASPKREIKEFRKRFLD